jgi:hypothetical protein
LFFRLFALYLVVGNLVSGPGVLAKSNEYSGGDYADGYSASYLLSLSARELQSVDVGLMHLICAQGLKGARSLISNPAVRRWTSEQRAWKIAVVWRRTGGYTFLGEGVNEVRDGWFGIVK